MEKINDGSDEITVCASCLTQACWNGTFYCENYKDADVLELTVAELSEMLKHRTPATGKEEKS